MISGLFIAGTTTRVMEIVKARGGESSENKTSEDPCNTIGQPQQL